MLNDEDRAIYRRLTDATLRLASLVEQSIAESRKQRTPRVSLGTVVLCLSSSLIVGAVFAACGR